MPTKQQIREQAARGLGLYMSGVTSGASSVGNTVVAVPKLADMAIDNERFRWSFLRIDNGAQAGTWRLVTSANLAGPNVTVQRAFSGSIIDGIAVSFYGMLSPEEWDTIIDEDVMPDIFRPDRATVPLVAGQTEYNITATASWLTSWGQVIRARFRNAQDVDSPSEGEVPAIYPVSEDNVLKVILTAFPASHNLVLEARRYYGALATDATTVTAQPRLLVEKTKHVALQRLFQRMGPAAKRIYGQSMVLTERALSEQELRHMTTTVRRDMSDEVDPVGGDPSGGIPWSW